MNKYAKHNYDATISPAILHSMIAELKIEVNGLLSDSAKDQKDIKLLREALWRNL